MNTPPMEWPSNETRGHGSSSSSAHMSAEISSTVKSPGASRRPP
ncbi:hypothetical protein V6758_04630 [Corynebacterium kalidii]